MFLSHYSILFWGPLFIQRQCIFLFDNFSYLMICRALILDSILSIVYLLFIFVNFIN